MSVKAFLNGRILIDRDLREGLAVIVDGARIQAVVPAAQAPAGAVQVDLQGGLLLPGFIDVQVNGGGDVLFNDAPSPETLRRIGAAHRRFGTTGFLPTVISDDLSVLAEAVRAVDQAIADGAPGVLGVHLEGPFLSVRRKGIHDSSKMRRLDDASLGLLTSLKRGRTLVTLAPERADPALISQLAAAGVIVSVGHTDAPYEEICAAFEAGASGVTHLFNAMSPLASRKPGAVGAALDNQQAWCGLIVDGRHVHPAVLRIALRSRPLDRFMLVTDAMPTVGGVLDGFTLQGRQITVVDGVCQDADGTLAGSHLDMAAAVRNTRDLVGLELADAVALASRTPAEFLGLGDELGRIAPGFRASLVLADDDLQVQRTWIDGLEADEAPAGVLETAAAR